MPKYQPLPLGSLAKFFVTQRISPLDQIVEFDNDPRFYLEKTTKKDRRKIIILSEHIEKIRRLAAARRIPTRIARAKLKLIAKNITKLRRRIYSFEKVQAIFNHFMGAPASFYESGSGLRPATVLEDLTLKHIERWLYRHKLYRFRKYYNRFVYTETGINIPRDVGRSFLYGILNDLQFQLKLFGYICKNSTTYSRSYK